VPRVHFSPRTLRVIDLNQIAAFKESATFRASRA
jgi:hypothetical protein